MSINLKINLEIPFSIVAKEIVISLATSLKEKDDKIEEYFILEKFNPFSNKGGKGFSMSISLGDDNDKLIIEILASIVEKYGYIYKSYKFSDNDNEDFYICEVEKFSDPSISSIEKKEKDWLNGSFLDFLMEIHEKELVSVRLWSILIANKKADATLEDVVYRITRSRNYGEKKEIEFLNLLRDHFKISEKDIKRLNLFRFKKLK